MSVTQSRASRKRGPGEPWAVEVKFDGTSIRQEADSRLRELAGRHSDHCDFGFPSGTRGNVWECATKTDAEALAATISQGISESELLQEVQAAVAVISWGTPDRRPSSCPKE